MTQSEFNDLWTMEDMPACPAGMALLKTWYDRMPIDVVPPAMLMSLADPSTRVIVKSDSPELEAYWEHRGSCEDCNEV